MRWIIRIDCHWHRFLSSILKIRGLSHKRLWPRLKLGRRTFAASMYAIHLLLPKHAHPHLPVVTVHMHIEQFTPFSKEASRIPR